MRWSVLAVLVLAAGLVACAFKDKPGRVTTPDVAAEIATPDIGGAGDETASDTVAASLVEGPEDWVTETGRVPLHLHATWQNDPATTVTLQWSTIDTTVQGYEPRVWYAKASELVEEGDQRKMPFDGSRWKAGLGYNYTELLTKDDPYVQFEVELTGLDPYTEYVYRAGTWRGVDAANGTLEDATLSRVQRFRTAPAKGRANGVRFVLAGDSRGGYQKMTEHAPRLAAIEANYWLFTGDMNLIGTPAEWTDWFDAMEPVSGRHVLMPVQGNHETLANLYYQQFALPREGAPLPSEWVEHAWHAVTGNVLIVALNSNSDAVAELQAPWLEATLKAYEDDPDIVWRLALFHHPAYSASNHGSTTRVQKFWVPLFEKYHVDLTMAGHDHNYERTVPVRGGQAVGEGEGVVHVTCGAFFVSAPYSNGQDWWTAISHHGEKWNYATLESTDKTLHVVAYSGDGIEVLDEFTLTTKFTGR